MKAKKKTHPFPYSVTVGNLGTVYEHKTKAGALTMFRFYVKESKYDIGRAAGEDVTLWKNGEPIKEFIGSLSLLADRE